MHIKSIAAFTIASHNCWLFFRKCIAVNSRFKCANQIFSDDREFISNNGFSFFYLFLNIQYLNRQCSAKYYINKCIIHCLWCHLNHPEIDLFIILMELVFLLLILIFAKNSSFALAVVTDIFCGKPLGTSSNCVQWVRCWGWFDILAMSLL